MKLQHVFTLVFPEYNLHIYVLQKLARRLKNLNNASWSVGKVAKVAAVLTPEYISSEESKLDEQNRVVHYSVRRLSWESRRLAKAKKKLDKVHKESLPGVVKRLVFPRKNGQPSTRQKPHNCPNWTCTSTAQFVTAPVEAATLVANAAQFSVQPSQ